MKFFDDKSKNIKWWNRNYFFLATIFYIAINIIFYTIFAKNSFSTTHSGFLYFWDSFFFYLKEAYIHSSWGHVLHNMLCFAIPAFYLERKNGTVFFGLLILFISVCSAMIRTGQSFIWAFMMGYMLIDYIFSFKKEKRNKTNIIVGAIVLFLIYFRCCFYDTASGGISITWYPYQLIHNLTHTEGYLLGLVTGFVIQISQLFVILQSNKKEVERHKINKFEKKLYIVSLCLILCLSGATIGTSFAAIQRDTYTINYVCEKEEFNRTYTTNKNMSTFQWRNETGLTSAKLEFYKDKEMTKRIELLESEYYGYRSFELDGFCKLSLPREITIYVEILSTNQ